MGISQPQGTTATASAVAPAATTSAVPDLADVRAKLNAKLSELGEQYNQDWLDAGCPSGNGEGSYASEASKKLFAEAFRPALEWLEKTRNVEFWTEFKDSFEFWEKTVQGNLILLLDFMDLRDEFAYSAPKTGGGSGASDVDEPPPAPATPPPAPITPPPSSTPVEDDDWFPRRDRKSTHMVGTNHRMSRDEVNIRFPYLGPFTEEEWEMLLCGERYTTEADLYRLLKVPFSTACIANTAGYDYEVVEDPTKFPPTTPVKCPHLCAGCNGRETCNFTVADFIAGPVQIKEELPLPPSRAVAGLPSWMEEPEEEYDETPVKCGRRCPDCHGSGCGLVRGDFKAHRVPPAAESCLTPPPFHMTWQMFRLNGDPSAHCEVQTDTRTVETHKGIADEMTQFVQTEYPRWKRKGRLDYWVIYNQKGKQLHLDELPPMVLTHCPDDRDLPLRAYQPPRPRLTVDDLGRINELTPHLADEEFPLRVEFIQEDEEYGYDQTLLTLNIASEKSRKEWRKNAIEEARNEERRRECHDYVGDYGPNEDW